MSKIRGGEKIENKCQRLLSPGFKTRDHYKFGVENWFGTLTRGDCELTHVK
jgi:hypothetical protein